LVRRDGLRGIVSGHVWRMTDGKWQMANDRWQMTDDRLQMTDGRWQMVQDLRSAARLSWIMFHLPCSPLYHDVPEGVEGSHPIADCRGDHGRYEPDREMECGNALDCW